MLYKGRYRTSSTRLPNWDYRSAGYYFVTICVRQRWEQPFGFIKNGFVCLSDVGAMVARSWLQTSVIRTNVQLDAWVIMPDHLHGIIKMNDSVDYHDSVETHCNASLPNINHPQPNINHPQPNINHPQPNINHPQPNINDHDKNPQDHHHNTNGDRQNPNHQTIRKYNKFGPQSNNIPAIIRGFKGMATKQIHEKYPNRFFQWQPRYYEKIIRSEQELQNVRNYIVNNPKIIHEQHNDTGVAKNAHAG